jgi:hypothetical protein
MIPSREVMRSHLQHFVDFEGFQDASRGLHSLLVSFPFGYGRSVGCLREIDIFIAGLERSRKSRVAFSIPP